MIAAVVAGVVVLLLASACVLAARRWRPGLRKAGARKPVRRDMSFVDVMAESATTTPVAAAEATVPMPSLDGDEKEDTFDDEGMLRL